MPSDSEDIYGPTLPPSLNPNNDSSSKQIIGPSLSPSMKIKNESEKPEDEEEEEDCYGPALPPHLLKRKLNEEEELFQFKNKIPILEKKSISSESAKNDEDDDSDDEIIGPVPADTSSKSNHYTQQKLEERAWRLKNEFLKKNIPVEKKREEWMLELPPAHSAANFGLAPRKFRTREGPDMSDRSMWTDTPADRERKRIEKMNKASDERPRKEKKRDERQGKKTEEKKSRKEEKSLLELHQEKMKKKRKEEEKEAKEAGRTLRRPFDRDIDLKVGGLSEKDKKSIFSKSQLLNDRFCHGKM